MALSPTADWDARAAILARAGYSQAEIAQRLGPRPAGPPPGQMQPQRPPAALGMAQGAMQASQAMPRPDQSSAMMPYINAMNSGADSLKGILAPAGDAAGAMAGQAMGVLGNAAQAAPGAIAGAAQAMPGIMGQAGNAVGAGAGYVGQSLGDTANAAWKLLTSGQQPQPQPMQAMGAPQPPAPGMSIGSAGMPRLPLPPPVRSHTGGKRDVSTRDAAQAKVTLQTLLQLLATGIVDAQPGPDQPQFLKQDQSVTGSPPPPLPYTSPRGPYR